jgi:hypothetical protein
MSTECAEALEPQNYVNVLFLCLMNSVVVHLLVWALLARDVRRSPLVPPLRRPSAPLTMHAAVSSALGRRLSVSDSALFVWTDNAGGPSPVREHGEKADDDLW